MGALRPAALAEARSRGYALLGGLLMDGLSPARLAALRATALAEHLPDPLDLDSLAADHHRLLSMEVFPYAGVYLDPEASSGGPAAAGILDACRSAGFQPDTATVLPDHLGLCLMLLSFLAGAEADALEDDLPQAAARAASLAMRFLDAWLLPWLAPVLGALPEGLWPEVVRTAAALATDHRGAGSTTRPLPEAPQILADPKTDLRRIARFLTTPCHSGVLLTRRDIAALGRDAGVPRGFGARQLELTNLLHSAAEYDALSGLLTRLDALIEARIASYGAAALPEVHRQLWIDRAAQTRHMLAEMKASAG